MDKTLLNTMKKIKCGNASGFTLIELMIVLAIMTILATYAYPSYQEHMNKTRRAEGQILLLDVLARQERFFTEQNTYTLNLADLGYTLNAANALESDGGFYAITATACAAAPITNCVQLLATPPADSAQADDGILNIDSRNQKSRVRPDGTTFPW